MKVLLMRRRLSRCSRAHLFFVALLLAIYLATLVFFHVELDDTSPQLVTELHKTHYHVVASEKILFDAPRPHLIAEQRKHIWNGSTRVSTTVHQLERCDDVQTIPLANDSSAEDQMFGSWPRIINRHPIDLVAPTLPWCFDQHDPTPVAPHHTAVNDSSSFQRLAGHHYVYSAYYDDREPSSSWGVVRVIAVLKTGSATLPTPTLFCHVDMSPGGWSIVSMMMMMMLTSRYYTAPLQYYEMCENHGKDYGGWILTCPLPRGLRRPPCHILLSSSETIDPSSVVSLPVFTTRPAANPDSAPVRFGYIVM